MAFLCKAGGILKQSLCKRSIIQEVSASIPSIFQTLRCMSSSRLFIGGLSYSTDDNSLKEAFGNYGQVTEARVILDRETGRSRGFGFVTFATPEEASSAIQALDGQPGSSGRMVRVNYANERPSNPGYGDGGVNGGGSYGGGSGGYGGGGYGGSHGSGYGGGYGRGGGYGGGSYGGGADPYGGGGSGGVSSGGGGSYGGGDSYGTEGGTFTGGYGFGRSTDGRSNVGYGNDGGSTGGYGDGSIAAGGYGDGSGGAGDGADGGW